MHYVDSFSIGWFCQLLTAQTDKRILRLNCGEKDVFETKGQLITSGFFQWEGEVNRIVELILFLVDCHANLGKGKQVCGVLVVEFLERV